MVHEHSSGAAILVSNNRYRLGHAVGSGTRPKIDDGLLGVTVASAPTGRGERRRLPQRPWREWSTPEFEVDADGPVAAGVDGEALTAGPATSLPNPARRTASADRPRPSGRLALRRDTRRLLGDRPCTGADRYRACSARARLDAAPREGPQHETTNADH